MTKRNVSAKLRLAKAAEAAKGLFKASDGIKLYFEDSGGSGPVLFFLYGLGCAISHWKYQMRFFGATHRIVWLDYRGHHSSGALGDGQEVTLGALAEDVRELCKQRAVTRAVFLGQSMGGSIAMRLAAEAPSLVRALVLQGSPGRSPSRGFRFGPLANPLAIVIWKQLLRLSERNPEALRALYHAFPVATYPTREIIRLMGFNPLLVSTADVQEYVDNLMLTDPTVFFALAKDLEAFDISRFESPVRAPALILAGGKDRVVPLDEARWLAKQLPASSLAVIPHGSHCSHMDDPSLINEHIAAFLHQQEP